VKSLIGKKNANKTQFYGNYGKRKHSSENSNSYQVKTPRNGSSPVSDLIHGLSGNVDLNESVSNSLHQTNSVLLEAVNVLDNSVLDNSVFVTDTGSSSMSGNQTSDACLASQTGPPTDAPAVSAAATDGSAAVTSSTSSIGRVDDSKVPPRGTPQHVSARGSPTTPSANITEPTTRSATTGAAPATTTSPTDDIINYLRRIESKLNHVDNRLNALDLLEKKVSAFELDMTELWTFVYDQNKMLDSRVISVEDRVCELEFSLAAAQSELQQVRDDEARVRDDLNYVKSQSMRNNLVFGNIPESKPETWEESESALRSFLHDKLKLANDLVSAMQFERVHRMGEYSRNNRYPRKLVAKFASNKDKEAVRRQSGNLKDTDFFLHEQFPPDIATRRRALLPALKTAKREGKCAWLSYDKLFINGKPATDDDLGTYRTGTGNRPTTDGRH